MHGECKEMEEGCSLSAHLSTCICIKKQFCWISLFCYFPKQDAFSSSSAPPGKSITLLLSDLCSALVRRGACVCVCTCTYIYLCDIVCAYTCIYIYLCTCVLVHAPMLLLPAGWCKAHFGTSHTSRKAPPCWSRQHWQKSQGEIISSLAVRRPAHWEKTSGPMWQTVLWAVSCLLTLGLCCWFMPWHKSPTPGGSPGQQCCCYTGCCSLLALHHFPEWGQEHLLTPSCCPEPLALFWWKTPGLATQIYFCNANKVSICK